jgi:hypothetical protein
MKEQSAARLINELGVTVFDNKTPSATADPSEYGSTSGKLFARVYSNIY